MWLRLRGLLAVLKNFEELRSRDDAAPVEEQAGLTMILAPVFGGHTTHGRAEHLCNGRNMKVTHIEIRRRQDNTADAALYRDIRLEALTVNPEAFGSSFETESVQPLSWFSDRLSISTVLGAFSDTKLVAVAGFAIQEGQKLSHKGTLWGMYVRLGARGMGVGRRLVEAVLNLARLRVELIQLTVVKDNEQARRLYASLGFPDYGLETHALKQNGRYYDEVLMAKNLLSR
jgi:ribosomal protein S18 acetylase RimI-like enzyme